MEIQMKTDNFIHEEPPPPPPPQQQSKRKLIPDSIKKKRKLKELERLNSDQLSSSEDDFSDVDSNLLPSDTNTAKLKKMHHKKNKAAAAAAKKDMSMSDRYKLAKAQFQYISRENEMLCDEWASTEKVLKKLKTERKVLLDALVKKRYRDDE